MKGAAVICGALLIVLLGSGCTLEMLGYYDDTTDKSTTGHQSKVISSKNKKDPEEEVLLLEERVQTVEEISPQVVMHQDLSDISPAREDKHIQQKSPDDSKKKTPEEIEKMKQEAKERVVSRQDKPDEEFSDENKGLSSGIAWKGYSGEKTLRTEHVNAKTGEIYPEGPGAYEEDASIIIRVYYNGQYVEGNPVVYAKLKRHYDVMYTITKDHAWVKNEDGMWTLDVCKVDYKNNKFESLL